MRNLPVLHGRLMPILSIGTSGTWHHLLEVNMRVVGASNTILLSSLASELEGSPRSLSENIPYTAGHQLPDCFGPLIVKSVLSFNTYMEYTEGVALWPMTACNSRYVALAGECID